MCPLYGQFFDCGKGAITCLPSTWHSSCTQAVVAPQVTLHTRAQIMRSLQTPSSFTHYQIFRKGTPVTPVVTWNGLFLAAGLGTRSIGMATHFYTQLSFELISCIYSVSKSASLQDQMKSLATAVLQNHQILYVLTAEKGGTCATLGEKCCYFINESKYFKTLWPVYKKELMAPLPGIRGGPC